MPPIEYTHRRIDTDGTEHSPGSTAEVSAREAETAESYGYGFRVSPESETVDDEKTPGEVDATAAAVDLADEHGLDLSQIDGSGKAGRILKADVEVELSE